MSFSFHHLQLRASAYQIVVFGNAAQYKNFIKTFVILEGQAKTLDNMFQYSLGVVCLISALLPSAAHTKETWPWLSLPNCRAKAQRQVELAQGAEGQINLWLNCLRHIHTHIFIMRALFVCLLCK